MSRRRKAREIALQTLYAEEVSSADWEEIFRETVERRKSSGEAVDYARRLISQVIKEREDLDKRLSERLENWRLDRVSIVDKNILRIALVELLYCPDTPTNVIINEAIEVAHRFSSADVGRFINGVLDRLAREVRPS
ncbi:MAG: transcription antitermination factor NusB [Candidatus Krumholzibacteria bacterium]|nr:transcription antitermination factor NusB [Candidatus Krumholzibacteria bacterium]